mmetsp:Transcript_23002/g.3790  ORF Transcript_23002/g.3790 Transcript_23002/m.3790 type:complete len:81 (-) Transcript_23002:257-499(-)
MLSWTRHFKTVSLVASKYISKLILTNFTQLLALNWLNLPLWGLFVCSRAWFFGSVLENSIYESVSIALFEFSIGLNSISF